MESKIWEDYGYTFEEWVDYWKGKTAEELRAPCLELTHENELVSKFLITIEEEDPE